MKKLAERRLLAILKAAQIFPTLRKKAGIAPRLHWHASVRIVGSAVMSRLNGEYRGKHYATDVLSFHVPSVFLKAGQLGELVICLPVLRRQAREIGHSERRELDVLLAHGVLHLLGLDHERGPQEAAEMARWERKVLDSSGAGGSKRVQGLVGRSQA